MSMTLDNYRDAVIQSVREFTKANQVSDQILKYNSVLYWLDELTKFQEANNDSSPTSSLP